jgi:hypothetical protein
MKSSIPFAKGTQLLNYHMVRKGYCSSTTAAGYKQPDSK